MALSKLTKVQTLGIGSNIEVVGVITTGQFKSGTSNLHSSGVELTNLNVSGIATIGGNVSIGGTLTYQDVTNIDSVGIVTARQGIHIDDSIVHIGDTNTKIRFPANDEISLETSGHDRIYIKSNGSVGIGTDTPIGGLHLNSNGNNGISFRMENYEGYSSFHNDGGALHLDSGQHIFRNQAGSTEFARITSVGNMGVGVASPSARLHVSGGNGLFVERSAGTSVAGFKNSGASAMNIYFQNSGSTQHPAVGSTNEDLTFITGNAEKMRLLSDGKFIKGHTSNIGQIRTQFQTHTQLYGSSNSTGLKIGTFSNDPYAGNLEFVKSRSATIGTNTLVQNNDNLGSIYWGAADGSQYQPAAVIAANMDGSTGTNDIPTRLSFFTAADGANGPSEGLRIDSGGRIFTGNDTTLLNSERGSLHISGGGTQGSRVSIRGTATGAGNGLAEVFAFWDTNKVAGMIAFAGEDTTNKDDGKLNFYTADGGGVIARMLISKEGYVTKPYMPIASLSSSHAVDLTNVVLTSSNFYNTTYVNQGSHFNASTGRFTCPVAGVYRIYFRATCDQGQHTNVRLRKNGSTINEAYANHNSGETSSDSSEAVVNCSVNDYLEIQASRLKTLGGGQHKQITFQLLH